MLLRNILGPIFNASLDQFLTLGFFVFFVFFFFFGRAETPIFIVFSAKDVKFKEKIKKTLFVSTPVLTALVNMFILCIFFIFDFLFLQFPNFDDMFFDW